MSWEDVEAVIAAVLIASGLITMALALGGIVAFFLQ